MKPIARHAAFALIGLLGLSSAAQGAVVVVDFDSMRTNVRVNGFYGGGVDSLGASGPDLGIEFVDFITAAAGSPARHYIYNATNLGVFNVADGFTAFAFDYATMAPAILNVYAGLNGSGLLLGSESVEGSAASFARGAVAFSGTGHSVTLAAPARYAALDELTFTTAQPPAAQQASEPPGWAVMIAGIGAIVALGRRPRLLR